LDKKQIIMPLAVLAIVVIAASAIKGRKLHQSYLISRTVSIGQELINVTNSTRLVRIGDGLSGQLEQLLAHPTVIEDYRTGDAPGLIGNGSADCLLLLSNTHGKRLGIRLRQDSDPEKFHVLGWWNLSTNETLK
jgi:hypothetical protein